MTTTPTYSNFRLMPMEELTQIVQHLKEGRVALFHQQIVQRYQQSLSNYIQEQFSDLQHYTASILGDVFRKFQKKLMGDAIGQGEIEGILRKMTADECELARPTAANRQKNLGLTYMEFKELVQQLRMGDNTLFEKAFLGHFKKSMNYLIYHCNASYNDAYNSTTDALLELRKDLIKGKLHYENIAYYFTGRAKTKLSKRIAQKAKTPVRVVNIEGMDFEDRQNTMGQLLKKEQKAIVVQCIKKLCKDCRKVLELHYYNDMNFKEIADMMGKSHVAIRKQATRCRDKLRKYLKAYF